ncbi:tight adherence protein B [Salinibacterium sp. CAN_S4]|uniref:type II secretion system F family protein n=1 Tax=Salinibacterium sp. CAN_S4 TaxID=2787727 RepID=UPI0018EFA577
MRARGRTVPSRTEPLAEVAAVTQRLSVLLAAGVTPGSAWQHVATSTGSVVAARVAASPSAPVADTVLAEVEALDPVEGAAWRGLAAAWTVATRAGAPLAPCLRRYAQSLRDLAQTQRDASVALAAPAATARMVLALPVVGVLFGMALGFNTLAVLFGTPVGWVCLAVGAALMATAWRWNAAMVVAARPKDPAPGISCDLMAIAVSGGNALDHARSIVDEAVVRFSLPAVVGVDEVLELSRSAGVPAADLLTSEAEELRRVATARAQESAAALGVRLMLPLGLCILPAFMVLGVLPLLVAVITSTVGSF